MVNDEEPPIAPKASCVTPERDGGFRWKDINLSDIRKHGVFHKLPTSNRRTARRRCRRKKQLVGKKQVDWIVKGAKAAMERNYIQTKWKPLLDYIRAAQVLTTEKFMKWVHLVNGLEEAMRTEGIEWTFLKKGKVYDELGMEYHSRVFQEMEERTYNTCNRRVDDDVHPLLRSFQGQKKDLRSWLCMEHNDIMVTGLDYDGLGNVRVAGYTTGETKKGMTYSKETVANIGFNMENLMSRERALRGLPPYGSRGRSSWIVREKLNFML